MTGHRQSLSAMQTRALAKPIMRFEPLPHDPDAITISNPALTRWQTRSAA